MIWNNALANYAQFMFHILSMMLHKFDILFLLSLHYKTMSISRLSSFSTIQHTINNSSTYVYKHFEFTFVAFETFFNTHFDKIITTDSSKSHNPMKSVHFIQILSNACAGIFCPLCWYYAHCFCFPTMLKIMLAK